ncbi:uncharacterized protein LOC129916054 [Episyrphus balteatus]|uniref:uncharacterized protein LOC129916054 n=1 Tax=Episyrphus balteatus TaxID=286459 RepID=UPI002484FBF9|nr:uncharacterized protein LOC129916054 [Episyrphus balteatus]
MIPKLLCLVFLGSIILGISNGAPLNSNEEEARKFAENVSNSIKAYYNKLAEDTMALDTEDFASFFIALETLLSKSDAIIEVVHNASLFDQSKFQDEELKGGFP